MKGSCRRIIVITPACGAGYLGAIPSGSTKNEKENNLTPSLPKGFKDRWGKELALKKKILKIIEANFTNMDFYHWKLLQWKSVKI